MKNASLKKRPILKRIALARFALVIAIPICFAGCSGKPAGKPKVSSGEVRKLFTPHLEEHSVEIVRIEKSTIVAPDGKERPVIYAWTKDDECFMATDLEEFNMDIGKHSAIAQSMYSMTREAFRALEEAEPGKFDLISTVAPSKRLTSVGFHRLLFKVGDGPSGIWKLAKTGDTSSFEKRMAAGEDIRKDVSSKNSQGLTPLMAASANGQPKAVTWLLENGADINAKAQEESTALHLAAFFAHQEVVRALIENGADINQKNKGGETPLDSVTHKWNQSLQDLYAGIGLLLQVDVDIKRIERDLPKVAELIRSNGGKQNPDLDVFAAIRIGRISIVEKHLADGKDVEAKSPQGYRLLYYAAALGQKEIVELLLENGADIDARDRKWPTALAIAADFCRRDVVELLLEKGADPDLKVVSGKAPQTALESVTEPWTEEMAGGYFLLGLTLGHPCDPERIKRDRPEMARLLREAGAK